MDICIKVCNLKNILKRKNKTLKIWKEKMRRKRKSINKKVEILKNKRIFLT